MRSWSQEGEDLVLARIFESLNNGFYVDVGAHHPKRFSNTQLFYLRGWSGVNIDPLPGSMRLFDKLRPRDTNLEVGVASNAKLAEYFMFDEPALNGFSAGLSKSRDSDSSPFRLIGSSRVQMFPLSTILNTYVGNRQIDFLSVDVEGSDLDVLRSNNWDAHRPRVVLAEALDFNLDKAAAAHPVYSFMRSVGYTLFAKTLYTLFFSEP